MFGFLFLVFVILVITCSETTILLCYFHLCAEVNEWTFINKINKTFLKIHIFELSFFVLGLSLVVA